MFCTATWRRFIQGRSQDIVFRDLWEWEREMQDKFDSKIGDILRLKLKLRTKKGFSRMIKFKDIAVKKSIIFNHRL